MKNGFSIVIIIITLSILGAALLGYIGYISESANDKVKGASSKNNLNSGFSITINSPITWDFYEYLCKDLEECKKSLVSGKKYASISGGDALNHELVVTFAGQWADYEYIKIFMKSSSADVSEPFNIKDLGGNESMIYTDFVGDSGSKTYSTLIPIKLIQSQYLENIAEFSIN